MNDIPLVINSSQIADIDSKIFLKIFAELFPAYYKSK